MCQACNEQRAKFMDAFLDAKIAEAVRLAAEGLAMMTGLKDKPNPDA